METETELKQRSEVADAELGVAEELGWPLAILAGIAVHLQWSSWPLTVASSIGTYVLSIYRYRRRSAQAEDSYYRAAKLEKYAGKN
jgi:hypothetical protein